MEGQTTVKYILGRYSEKRTIRENIKKEKRNLNTDDIEDPYRPVTLLTVGLVLAVFINSGTHWG